MEKIHQLYCFLFPYCPNFPDGPGERFCSHTAVVPLGVNREFAMENLSKQGPDGQGDMLFISPPVWDRSKRAVNREGSFSCRG